MSSVVFRASLLHPHRVPGTNKSVAWNSRQVHEQDRRSQASGRGSCGVHPVSILTAELGLVKAS